MSRHRVVMALLFFVFVARALQAEKPLDEEKYLAQREVTRQQSDLILALDILRWHPIYLDDHLVVGIDKTRAKRDSVWLKWLYASKPNDKYDIVLNQMLIDCSDPTSHRLRMMEGAHYKGGQLLNSTAPEPQMHDPIPETAGEMILTAACQYTASPQKLTPPYPRETWTSKN